MTSIGNEGRFAFDVPRQDQDLVTLLSPVAQALAITFVEVDHGLVNTGRCSALPDALPTIL